MALKYGASYDAVRSKVKGMIAKWLKAKEPRLCATSYLDAGLGNIHAIM
jgi:hypothetical protein